MLKIIAIFLIFVSVNNSFATLAECSEEFNVCSGRKDICTIAFVDDYQDKNNSKHYASCIKKNFYTDKKISSYCNQDKLLCHGYYNVISGSFCDKIDGKMKEDLKKICERLNEVSKKNKKPNKLSRQCRNIVNYRNCIDIKRYDINYRRRIVKIKIVKELRQEVKK